MSVTEVRPITNPGLQFVFCFIYLKSSRVRPGRSQELQQQLHGVFLFGLNYVHTVDGPPVKLEGKLTSTLNQMTCCSFCSIRQKEHSNSLVIH